MHASWNVYREWQVVPSLAFDPSKATVSWIEEKFYSYSPKGDGTFCVKYSIHLDNKNQSIFILSNLLIMVMKGIDEQIFYGMGHMAATTKIYFACVSIACWVASTLVMTSLIIYDMCHVRLGTCHILLSFIVLLFRFEFACMCKVDPVLETWKRCEYILNFVLCILGRLW